MASYYDGASLLRTKHFSCLVQGENNQPHQSFYPNADVMMYVGLRGRGICSGITTAWMIGFLNGERDARDPSRFKSYFMSTLKPQGAYFKHFGGRIAGLLARVHSMSGGKHPYTLTKTGEVQRTRLRASDIPYSTWAAYVSMWNHAVAFGATDGYYYIMDPNCGLLTYVARSVFLKAADSIIESWRQERSKGKKDAFSMFFYRYG